MKMKRTMCAAMAAAMAVSAAGCGNSASTSETTAAAGGSETTAAAGGSETAAADSGASAEGEFVLGGSGPLTGSAAIYGNAVKNGGQIAVDEINAAGGINGHQVKWIFEDDEADAEKAVNAYNTLKDGGMQMFVGTTTSGACMAVIAETENDNMFQITPSGSTKDITAPANVFRMCFSDPAQGTKSAEYIGQNKLATKVGVIYDNSDAYSSGIYENFVKEAPNQGIEVVGAESFNSESKTDFKTQLQKLKDAGSELVFLPFYYTEASLVLKQANEMGWAPKFFGCDGMDGILSLPDFDTSLAEGLMLLTPFSADASDELTQNFVAKYKEAYGDTPNQFAADAYDAVYVIKAAAETAGITPDMSVSDITDAMEPAMLEVKMDGLTGKDISFDEEGEPNKAPKAVEIVSGAYKSLE
ncbi:MAG: ABC transporter substrate-binding protein [Eubacteriales bacterium]|nr:ABC transporter substrate-binding protein [Eubacteriales bacterium]